MISLTKCISTFGSTCRRHYSKFHLKKDPGISRRKVVVDPVELQDNVDVEIDDFEADFMDVQKSFKEHVKEIEAKTEQLKYLIVKQKYYKEKYPNFLTWQDKEQIRFLHNKDPEEWSVENLSDSFPALPETVKKIIKSKFTKSDSKCKNHNAVVENNWENFKRGNFDNLPPDLVEHLNKFTGRKLNTQHNVKQEIINNPKIQSEFSEIVSSYEKIKNKSTDSETSKNLKIDIKAKKNSDSDSYLIVPRSKMKDKKEIILSDLQEGIKNKAIRGQKLSEEEQVIYKDIAQPEEKSIALNEADVFAITENKYNNSASSLVKKTEKDYSHLIYPEKIIIPKELKKRGYTYRLNDCYYDYDGEFLYRVPGMG